MLKKQVPGISLPGRPDLYLKIPSTRLPLLMTLNTWRGKRDVSLNPLRFGKVIAKPLRENLMPRQTAKG